MKNNYQQSEISYKGITFVPYITKEKIQEQTKRVADELTKEYEGKFPLIIGILNGSFVWTADLIR
jgi:hypoxanthine phosphoribosyltransferase